MKRLVLASGLLVSSLILSAPGAFAADDDTKFYVGVSAGQSNFNDACDGLDTIGFVGSCDDDDTGWKIFGGYNFNQNFGVEAAWVDLGEATANGTIGAAAATANVEVDGFNISAVGRVPLGEQFSLFGKLGLYVWDASASATVATTSVFLDNDGTDISFGAGGQYDFSKNFGVRAEWERFSNVADDDVDLFTVGIAVKF